jgi:septal ring factor EnvC (AmiA/AmiB activator)
VLDLTKQLDERDERHRAEQLEHQAKISQLKEKLEALKKENEAEVEKVIASFAVSLTKEKERLEAKIQKYKDRAVNAEREREREHWP